MAQENIYKRRFGDRKEGRLIRSIDPITKFMPYIMRDRSDGCNQFEDSIDIAPAENGFAKNAPKAGRVWACSIFSWLPMYAQSAIAPALTALLQVRKFTLAMILSFALWLSAQ